MLLDKTFGGLPRSKNNLGYSMCYLDGPNLKCLSPSPPPPPFKKPGYMQGVVTSVIAGTDLVIGTVRVKRVSCPRTWLELEVGRLDPESSTPFLRPPYLSHHLKELVLG